MFSASESRSLAGQASCGLEANRRFAVVSLLLCTNKNHLGKYIVIPVFLIQCTRFFASFSNPKANERNRYSGIYLDQVNVTMSATRSQKCCEQMHTFQKHYFYLYRRTQNPINNIAVERTKCFSAMHRFHYYTTNSYLERFLSYI